MKCERVRENLALYLYGELSPQTEEDVEQHVHECPDCRRELEIQRGVHTLLDERQTAPSGMLLAECRRNLMQTIDASRAVPRSWWRRVWERFEVPGGVWKPAGALALVAIGFFGARLTNPLPGGPGGSAANEPLVSAIRWVQPDPSGGVQIALDETRRRMVTGRVEDDHIERLLLRAARDEANAGLRVESLDLLKSIPATDQVRQTLVHVLTHDANPGVRLKAMEGLKPMASHPEVRKTLARILLKDDNPGVRVQAIDLLVQQRDTDLVGLLQNLVRQENNNYVRMRCKNALQDMNASVGTF